MWAVNQETGAPFDLHPSEVLYIETTDISITFHTRDAVYRPPRSNRDYLHFLIDDGFERLSRKHLVNMSQVVEFDKISNKVFFDEEKDIPGIYVSESNRWKL